MAATFFTPQRAVTGYFDALAASDARLALSYLAPLQVDGLLLTDAVLKHETIFTEDFAFYLPRQPARWEGQGQPRVAAINSFGAGGANAFLVVEEFRPPARTVAERRPELVVLSACDTGRGDVHLGQGVYGLRRAFVVAGAETVVMSLWKVNDETTRELMEAYYRNLLAGQSRAMALHEAMRLLRATQPHPHHWAPFIALGQDAPLRALAPDVRL